MRSFAGWACKAVWPTFFRKIFVAGFLATELGYERRKSQFVFEWHNVIPPFSRFLITFYHFNSPIVRPLSDLTQRNNHIIKYFTDGYYENVAGVLDAVDAINKELRIYTGFINDTGKELPTIIAFEDILEIGVNMT